MNFSSVSDTKTPNRLLELITQVQGTANLQIITDRSGLVLAANPAAVKEFALAANLDRNFPITEIIPCSQELSSQDQNEPFEFSAIFSAPNHSVYAYVAKRIKFENNEFYVFTISPQTNSDSQDAYQSIFENAVQAICILQEDGKLLEANHAAI